jgi:uncharacterized membrane protein YeiH
MTPALLPIEPPPPIVLDYLGVLVFAATGALAAARKGYDIVTFAFFAAVTGIGGGTLRDLLIGAPVFWIRDGGYIVACLGAAAAVWLVGPRPRLFGALLWLDALGLVAYAIVGAAKADAWGVPALVCVAMGAITATVGGVIRDVLAGEPSVLLRREITITAALAAAAIYIALSPFVPGWGAAAIGFTVGFGLRAGALLYGWSLPAFTRSAPRP